MSIYAKDKSNLFLGYFTDLAELQAQYPSGNDGEYAGVNATKTRYYWDISSRAWTDSGEDYTGQVNVSDLEIGAVELKDGATDTRATIKADNAAAGTPNPVIIGGKYNAAAQTYDDGDAAALQMDVSGNLKVTGGASSVSAKFTSPSDFTATYTSASTITLSGVPITISDASQIVYVKQTKATNLATTYVAGSGGISFGVSSNVITVYQYGSVITSLVTGDVYEVGINAQDKAYDASTQSFKDSVLNPVYAHTTDPETLVSATPYELTASFADVGSEISVDTYNWLTLWLTIDIGTSTNPQIRILHKHTSAGTEEYREIYLGSPASNITSINLNDYEVNTDADQLFKITIPVTGSKYIQVQAKDDANGDGQIDALYCSKSW